MSMVFSISNNDVESTINSVVNGVFELRQSLKRIPYSEKEFQQALEKSLFLVEGSKDFPGLMGLNLGEKVEEHLNQITSFIENYRNKPTQHTLGKTGRFVVISTILESILDVGAGYWITNRIKRRKREIRRQQDEMVRRLRTYIITYETSKMKNIAERYVDNKRKYPGYNKKSLIVEASGKYPKTYKSQSEMVYMLREIVEPKFILLTREECIEDLKKNIRSLNLPLETKERILEKLKPVDKTDLIAGHPNATSFGIFYFQDRVELLKAYFEYCSRSCTLLEAYEQLYATIVGVGKLAWYDSDAVNRKIELINTVLKTLNYPTIPSIEPIDYYVREVERKRNIYVA